MLTAAQVAATLGISRQAVDKRRRAGTLIGVSLGRRGYAYPVWQFAPAGRMLPGLGHVLDALRDEGPWVQIASMVNANSRLNDELPLAALRRGEIETVLEAARVWRACRSLNLSDPARTHRLWLT